MLKSTIKITAPEKFELMKTLSSRLTYIKHHPSLDQHKAQVISRLYQKFAAMPDSFDVITRD